MDPRVRPLPAILFARCLCSTRFVVCLFSVCCSVICVVACIMCARICCLFVHPLPNTLHLQLRHRCSEAGSVSGCGAYARACQHARDDECVALILTFPPYFLNVHALFKHIIYIYISFILNLDCILRILTHTWQVPGRDVRAGEKRVEAAAAFVNKVFNAGRMLQVTCPPLPPPPPITLFRC